MRHSRPRRVMYDDSHASRTLYQGDDRRRQTRHLRSSTAYTDRIRPAAGSGQRHTGAGLAGVAHGAAYFLGIYRRAFLGQAHYSVIADAIDLRACELWVVGVLAVLVLAAGIYPDSVLELTRAARADWVRMLEPR